MTLEEFKNNLNFDLKLEKSQRAFLLAVKDIVGAQVVRVFEEGKNSSGGNIGKYKDNKGIYVGDTRSPRAGNHKGKPNKETGKAKTITTTYYESYESFRSKQGRESGFVNLRLFGRLMSDIANSPVSDKIPSDVKPIQINEFEYYTRVRDENIGKLKGAEAKYGTIFQHTKEEKERFIKTLEFELKKANA